MHEVQSKTKMAAPSAAISSELISQFQAVTGSNAEEARQLLEACNANLEMAIGMHLDSGGGRGSPAPAAAEASAGPAVPMPIDDDDNVRAPIPQRQEVLVEQPHTFMGFRGRRKRGQKSVFDGFRDFQREARLQQERMLENQASTSRVTRTAMDEKRGRLEDLFRPPIDLMYTGTFEAAKDHGSSERRWLMVNVQNVQEFCCQMLNRDVWSNDAVKAIVKEHFVLWQVYHDSEEGQRFNQFYKIVDWPYIAVLDPRTGEKLAVWNKVDAMAFCDLAVEFLSSHPTIDGLTTPDPAPAPKRRRVSDDCIVDADEDSQLQAAIKQSLRDAEVAKQLELSDDDEDNSDCELETFSDSEDETSRGAKTKHSPDGSGKSASSSSMATGKSTVNSVKGDKIRNGDIMVKQSTLKWKSLAAKQQNEAESEKREEIKEGGRSSIESLRAIAKVSVDRGGGRAGGSGGGGAGGGAGRRKEEVTEQEEEEVSPECWQRLLGPDTDPMTRLVLRLPDGGRIELKWSCNTQLKALREYANWMGYPLHRFELVTNYPRRNLSSLDADQSLKESGLHPQETIFVQEQDS